MEKLNELIVKVLLEAKKLKDEVKKAQDRSSYWYKEYRKLEEEINELKPKTKES